MKPSCDETCGAYIENNLDNIYLFCYTGTRSVMFLGTQNDTSLLRDFYEGLGCTYMSLRDYINTTLI